MTVRELMEYLEEFESSTPVKLAYQPSWPLATDANFVKEAVGTNYYGDRQRAVYICQSAYGGSEYTPGCIYGEDDEEEDE